MCEVQGARDCRRTIHGTVKNRSRASAECSTRRSFARRCQRRRGSRWWPSCVRSGDAKSARLPRWPARSSTRRSVLLGNAAACRMAACAGVGNPPPVPASSSSSESLCSGCTSNIEKVAPHSYARLSVQSGAVRRDWVVLEAEAQARLGVGAVDDPQQTRAPQRYDTNGSHSQQNVRHTVVAKRNTIKQSVEATSRTL